MKNITSRQNPEIKTICSLHSAKGRKQSGYFLAEGLRTLKTILGKWEPVQIYITEKLFNQKLIKLAPDKITLVSDEVMEKISTQTSHSGIIGIFKIPQNPHKALTKGLVLIDISDPGNMGTLMRTAAAMGSQTIIVIEGVDPWHPKVVQASAGTIACVDIFELTWQELMKIKKDFTLCALTVENGQSPHILTQEKILMVLGNEATGIPKQYLADCELQCTLAMPGHTESLNVAVAGSIALYLAFIGK